jgi:hypothetical protein
METKTLEQILAERAAQHAAGVPLTPLPRLGKPSRGARSSATWRKRREQTPR